ncbi:hypothetical protein NUU61_006314 [Penicillium alfredii]|uniref:Mannan endo-1,6-alpha-mannosidase n=1 Tax=Penicillium alfredii TaxID=1506179 RepID=A0A9W9F0M3_9EURO|nr:uncharacterized protein NUU61_006314 [Penicillium alfredii]KAJ5091444.1 hypothetical protein NUU61_006314 [Penicillium alfredii]
MLGLSWAQLWGAALLLLNTQSAMTQLTIQVTDKDSVVKAGQAIAKPMMKFYHENETEGIPGKLTDTWYVAGSMFMTWIQYWSVSNVDTYNDVVQHDLMFQSGRDYNYFDSNYSQWLGNDDQMFWGLATITASETEFKEVSGKPSWTSLAAAVFNMQIGRWDMTSCGGGERWQIWPIQNGYAMKNAISNGGLFALGARLARFTKNETYVQWADKIWDWSQESPILNNETYFICDSTSSLDNCAKGDHTQWTYNYGTYLLGAAYMYNYTKGDDRAKWEKRVDGLLETTFKTFYPKQYGGNVLSDITCEPVNKCDRNQLCFKGYLSMWLATTAILVPSTRDKITPKLQGSLEAVAKICSGESDNLCGLRWYDDHWDGTKGLEVQMAALGAVSSVLMLLSEGKGPSNVDSNPDAKEAPIDTGGGNKDSDISTRPITTGDKAGAWILTVLTGGLAAGGVTWLLKAS